jgi:hypothetical protein
MYTRCETARFWLHTICFQVIFKLKTVDILGVNWKNLKNSLKIRNKSWKRVSVLCMSGVFFYILANDHSYVTKIADIQGRDRSGRGLGSNTTTFTKKAHGTSSRIKRSSHATEGKLYLWQKIKNSKKLKLATKASEFSHICTHTLYVHVCVWRAPFCLCTQASM